MSTSRHLFLKLGVAIAFISAMVAIVVFDGDDFRLFLVAIFSLSVMAAVNHRQRQLFPILLIFICIRTVEVIFSFLFIEMLGLTYLLMSGLLELFFAFLLVHYSRDETLQKFCRGSVKTDIFPQIHWIAVILGFSCFYRVAASIELVLHVLDPNFFEGKIPFFFATGPKAMLVCRLAIDTLLWSMLLFPRKLSQFGHQRPRNLAS